MKVVLLVAILALATAASAIIMDSEWEDWKLHHQKQYKEDAVELRRYSVWKANLALVEKHNKEADKHDYTLEMNKFGDLTAAEFALKYNGYKGHPDKNSTRGFFRPSPGFVPKDSVDWRKSGAVTEVKNQGDCGSCWSFGTTGTLEGQHFLKTGQLVLLSEQNLIDCSTAQGNNGCKGGRVNKAFNYIIANDGIDTEFSYPYEGLSSKFCSFTQDSVGARMQDYKSIPHRDIDALTKAISSIGPIAVAIDASQSTFELYEQGVYSDGNCSSTLLDHVVLAVGYGVYEEKPYYLVKNSWGPEWGMDGYIMIARDSNMCGIATDATYPIV